VDSPHQVEEIEPGKHGGDSEAEFFTDRLSCETKNKGNPKGDIG